MPEAIGKGEIGQDKLFRKIISIEHLRSMMTTTITTIIMSMTACTVAKVTEFSKRKKNVVVIFYSCNVTLQKYR